MPVLSESALRVSLAAGTLGPLYVLVGADEVEKAAVAREMLDSVDEGLRAFNVERFYGAETDVDRLIDAASTFPMMVPRRVVLVLAAEGLLMPKRDSKAMDEALERLATFFDDPPSHATVVFVCGELDRRRRIVKRLEERAHVVDCGAIADVTSAERWVKARASRAAIALDGDAVRALIDRVGLDVGRLRSGLERVGLYAMGQARVTAQDVRESVPSGPDAPEDFGVANAIGNRDTARALQEVGAAFDVGVPPFVLLGQVRSAVERLAGGRVVTAMDAVLRTDLALKSSGADPRVLLERLVVELCLPSSPARTPARR